jgi:hypothetical protein
MLLPDGTYQRLRPENGAPLRRSQQRFIELARQSTAAPPPAPRDDAGERAVKRRENATKTGFSGVHLALLGKPSLPS